MPGFGPRLVRCLARPFVRYWLERRGGALAFGIAGLSLVGGFAGCEDRASKIESEAALPLPVADRPAYPEWPAANETNWILQEIALEIVRWAPGSVRVIGVEMGEKGRFGLAYEFGASSSDGTPPKPMGHHSGISEWIWDAKAWIGFAGIVRGGNGSGDAVAKPPVAGADPGVGAEAAGPPDMIGELLTPSMENLSRLNRVLSERMRSDSHHLPDPPTDFRDTARGRFQGGRV